MVFLWEGAGGPRGTSPDIGAGSGPPGPAPTTPFAPFPYTIAFKFIVRGKYRLYHFLDERHERRVIEARRRLLYGRTREEP